MTSTGTGPTGRAAEAAIIITGASSGVGLEAAKRLAGRGRPTFLLCRNEARGRPAIDEVRRASGSSDVHLVTADFASFAQLRQASEELLARCPRIELLVNNAGLARDRCVITEDGFELTFQVNHLSHFLLTLLLIGPLRAGSAHIINVSSEGHRAAKLNRRPLTEILRGEGPYSGRIAYSDSKLANVLLTLELARREGPRGVVSNALHPGVLATPIWNRNRSPLWMFFRLFKPLMKPPSVGGEAVETLAATAHRPTGEYYNVLERQEPTLPQNHEALALDLWRLSETAVGEHWPEEDAG